MKANVVYLNQVFNVNPDKQSVWCGLTYGIDLSKIPGISTLINNKEFEDLLTDLTNEYTGIADYEFSDEDGFGMIVFNTSGLAKCSGEDNFDAELGKKIASTRAQENSFKEAAKFYDQVLAIIENTFDGIYGFYDGCIHASKNCKQHVYDLTGYTPNY